MQEILRLTYPQVERSSWRLPSLVLRLKGKHNTFVFNEQHTTQRINVNTSHLNAWWSAKHIYFGVYYNVVNTCDCFLMRVCVLCTWLFTQYKHDSINTCKFKTLSNSLSKQIHIFLWRDDGDHFAICQGFYTGGKNILKLICTRILWENLLPSYSGVSIYM